MKRTWATSFKLTGPLLSGSYLMGSPRWAQPVSIGNVRVVCRAGSGSGPLTRTVLQMETGGQLVERRIHLLPLESAEEIQVVTALDYILPADTELRFKCVLSPGLEQDAVREIGLTLHATPASEDSVAGLPDTPASNEEFYVRWVNDQEDLRLLEYDPETHLFTESSAGISTGRASIDQDCTVTIDGTVALQIVDESLQVSRFIARGGTAATAFPRLEFWRGNQRLASLTKDGKLYVVDITEAATVSGGSDRFELYGNGSLAAVIGPVRLTGLSFQEI